MNSSGDGVKAGLGLGVPARSVPAAPQEAGTGVVGCSHDRLDVEQVLVRADLQNPGDIVFRLAHGIAVGAPGAILAKTHVTRAPRDDLVRQALAVVAQEILVTLVRWSGEPALREPYVPAATPRTLPC